MTTQADQKDTTRRSRRQLLAGGTSATPQDNIAGAAVRSAVPNVAGSSFTVHLAKAVSKAVTIGWFIVN
jgi:acyl-coenzyme A thioesterase PaaI-like protein